MPLVIRMSRQGRNNRPHFRVGVFDIRTRKAVEAFLFGARDQDRLSNRNHRIRTLGGVRTDSRARKIARAIVSRR